MTTAALTPRQPSMAATWIATSMRDPFLRRQMRDALHEAVHLRSGPMLPVLEDVLSDAGLTLTTDVTTT